MKSSDKQWLSHHSAHDYQRLVSRWNVLADKTGLEKVILAEQGEYDVFALRSGESVAGGGLYLSAGVHGDEPAAVWGLLEWAETNQERLAQERLTILPCVNPWGFANNVRLDDEGRDLNRLFQNETLPFFQAWRSLLGEQRFRLSLNLHEDYDAQGIYVYELASQEVSISEQVFNQVESVIQRDNRQKIDGQAADAGIVRHSGDIRRVVEEDLLGGCPEAIYLYLNHADLALTFETPSEFAFHERVRAQQGFIEGVLSFQQA